MYCRPMDTFTHLTAWQACHQMVLAIYRATDKWPVSERYVLTSQLRRAATSVPTNIAEGTGKRGGPEMRRYLDIALGSMAEVTYQLMLARDLGYLTREQYADLEKLRNHAGKLLWGPSKTAMERGKRS